MVCNTVPDLPRKIKTSAIAFKLFHHTNALAGAKRVVVMPDNDRAGEMLAQHICKQLSPVVGEVRILRLSEEISGFDEKGDFTDYVVLRKQNGMNSKSALRAEFDAMAERAPVWTPENVMPFPEEEKRKTVRADGFDGGDSGGDRLYRAARRRKNLFPLYASRLPYCFPRDRRGGRKADTFPACDPCGNAQHSA